MGEFSRRDERRRVVALSREPVLAHHLQGLLAPTVGCQAVSSPYEAAAEVLAEPPAVLVIDFRTISRCHLGLLGIARRMGVEMLGLGALPPGLSLEDLSGVRLVARDDLAAAVGRLTAAAAGQAEAQAPAASPAVAPPPAEQSRAADAAQAASLVPKRSSGSRGKPTRRKMETARRLRRPRATADRSAAHPTGPAGPAEPQAQAEIVPGAPVEADRPPQGGSSRPAPQAMPAASAAPRAMDAEGPQGQAVSGQPPAAAQRPQDLLTPEELAALLEHEP